MRKLLVTMLSLALIGGAIAAPAAQAKKPKAKKPVKITRLDKGTYQAPSLIAAGTCSQTDAVGCVQFTPGATETYISVTIKDQSGTGTLFAIEQDTNGDAQDDTTAGAFCGSTPKPVAINPAYPVHVWVENVADPNTATPCAAVATTGEVDVTFSNMP
ncbi:MAG: hypothetical protein QOF16_858 [Actinomycetota bacterium]|jgi:hypothetical protein|nr:hypothetical protein [Actinomycetota bacterium]